MLRVGVFCVDAFCAGVFCVGVFVVGVFCVGVFCVGVFVVGVFCVGVFCVGVFCATAVSRLTFRWYPRPGIHRRGDRGLCVNTPSCRCVVLYSPLCRCVFWSLSLNVARANTPVAALCESRHWEEIPCCDVEVSK